MDWSSIIKEYGVFAALTVFLVWKQSRDYTGVCRRLNLVEDYVKNTLVDLVKETTKALNRVNERFPHDKD